MQWWQEQIVGVIVGGLFGSATSVFATWYGVRSQKRARLQVQADEAGKELVGLLGQLRLQAQRERHHPKSERRSAASEQPMEGFLREQVEDAEIAKLAMLLMNGPLRKALMDWVETRGSLKFGIYEDQVMRYLQEAIGRVLRDEDPEKEIGLARKPIDQLLADQEDEQQELREAHARGEI